MSLPKNTHNRNLILEALHAGYHRPTEISQVTGIKYPQVTDTLDAMLKDDEVTKYGVGDYRPKVSLKERNAREDDWQTGVSTTKLEGYMLKREPVRVSFERDVQMFYDIVRVEFRADGNWYPVNLSPLTRLFVGDELPVWSPEQEVHHGVREIRLTWSDGQQRTYSHNPLHGILTLGAQRDG